VQWSRGDDFQFGHLSRFPHSRSMSFLDAADEIETLADFFIEPDLLWILAT
jgi:hypothetical protein